jgi:Fic family protein
MPTLQQMLQEADSCKYNKSENMIITEEVMQEIVEFLTPTFDPPQATPYRTELLESSDTDYQPASPEDIERLMSHLADQIRFSRSTLHPIELAAMAYKRFIDIAPFSKGNEEKAEQLMNLILVRCGYSPVTMPSPSSSPDQYKEYIEALTASRQTNDMEPFSKFIAGLVCCPTDK